MSEGRARAIAEAIAETFPDGGAPPWGILEIHAIAAIYADDAYLADHPDEAEWLERVYTGARAAAADIPSQRLYRVVKP